MEPAIQEVVDCIKTAKHRLSNLGKVKLVSCLPGNPHIYCVLNLLVMWFEGAPPHQIKAEAKRLVDLLHKLELV